MGISRKPSVCDLSPCLLHILKPKYIIYEYIVASIFLLDMIIYSIPIYL